MSFAVSHLRFLEQGLPQSFNETDYGTLAVDLGATILAISILAGLFFSPTFGASFYPVLYVVGGLVALSAIANVALLAIRLCQKKAPDLEEKLENTSPENHSESKEQWEAKDLLAPDRKEIAEALSAYRISADRRSLTLSLPIFTPGQLPPASILKKLSELQELTLNISPCKDFLDLNRLAEIPRLKRLSLEAKYHRSKEVHPVEFPDIRKLSCLEELTLDGVGVKSIPEWVAELPLYRLTIKRSLLEVIPQFPAGCRLLARLCYADFTHNGIKKIEGLESFQSLCQANVEKLKIIPREERRGSSYRTVSKISCEDELHVWCEEVVSDAKAYAWRQSALRALVKCQDDFSERKSLTLPLLDPHSLPPLAALASLQGLYELRVIFGEYKDGFDTSILSTFPNLRSLSLEAPKCHEKEKCTAVEFPDVEKIKSLRELSLRGIAVKSVPSYILKMPLRCLQIVGSLLTSFRLSGAHTLITNLETLDLSDNCITDLDSLDLDSRETLTSNTTLFLSNNPVLSDQAQIAAFKEKLSSKSSLNGRDALGNKIERMGPNILPALESLKF